MRGVPHASKTWKSPKGPELDGADVGAAVAVGALVAVDDDVTDIALMEVLHDPPPITLTDAPTETAPLVTVFAVVNT
jgi:hypothetical protein